MKLEEDKNLKCSACGATANERASVSVRMTNPWHRYNISNRAFVLTSSGKFCKKCFKKFRSEFDALIKKY